MAFTDLGGGDHGGADWTISTGTAVAGIHTNIGTFTVNSGVTATVQPYSGGSYGFFEVYANAIDVQGTINGNAAGYLGGNGGAGSNGEGIDTGVFSNGTSGSTGTGGYGGVGGSGGIWQNTGYGWTGYNGNRAGYLGAAANNDTTTNETVYIGSGGGGAGGGTGGRYNKPWIPNMGYGAGAGGGGGAGGRGGAKIILSAVASLSVTGYIYSLGAATGGNGTVGQAAGRGEPLGSFGYRYFGGVGGAGGSASSAGTGAGGGGGAGNGIYGGLINYGGAGGTGGAGAGGGILIKCGTKDGTTITGTIDNRGGGSSTTNGGTLKVFSYGTLTNSATIVSGRAYYGEATPPAVGYVRINGLNGRKLRLLDEGNAVYNCVKVYADDGNTYQADIHNYSDSYAVRINTPTGVRVWRDE